MSQTSECHTLACHRDCPTKHYISPPQIMPQKHDESRIILALQAMQNDPKLSARAAGKIYSVSHEKLSRRRRGMQPRRDIIANSRKLTNLEESVLVQYILDLATKGFPPQLSIVEDMANRLLATRDAPRVRSR